MATPFWMLERGPSEGTRHVAAEYVVPRWTAGTSWNPNPASARASPATANPFARLYRGAVVVNFSRRVAKTPATVAAASAWKGLTLVTAASRSPGLPRSGARRDRGYTRGSRAHGPWAP